MWALIGKVMVMALIVTGVMRTYQQYETRATCSAATFEFEQGVASLPQRAQLYAPANTDYFAKRLAKVRSACRETGGYEPDSLIRLPKTVLVRADALETFETMALH